MKIQNAIHFAIRNGMRYEIVIELQKDIHKEIGKGLREEVWEGIMYAIDIEARNMLLYGVVKEICDMV
jgi:hypothetical protein